MNRTPFSPRTETGITTSEHLSDWGQIVTTYSTMGLSRPNTDKLAACGAVAKVINVGEIAAADGMGETLKDAVVTMILLNETRKMEEENRAVSRFGWVKAESKEEQKANLRDMRILLQIKKVETQQQEGQFDEKKGASDRLKDGISKMKLRISQS